MILKTDIKVQSGLLGLWWRSSYNFHIHIIRKNPGKVTGFQDYFQLFSGYYVSRIIASS